MPALYTILAANKKDAIKYEHAIKALRMWIRFFALFFGLRLAINLVWRLIYIPYLDKLEIALAAYLAYCAISAAKNCYKK